MSLFESLKLDSFSAKCEEADKPFSCGALELLYSFFVRSTWSGKDFAVDSQGTHMTR